MGSVRGVAVDQSGGAVPGSHCLLRPKQERRRRVQRFRPCHVPRHFHPARPCSFTYSGKLPTFYNNRSCWEFFQDVGVSPSLKRIFRNVLL